MPRSPALPLAALALAAMLSGCSTVPPASAQICPRPPAGRADAADAATAASDTQVAQWAGSAIHQYAECARRLDALIQFNEAPQ